MIRKGKPRDRNSGTKGKMGRHNKKSAEKSKKG